MTTRKHVVLSGVFLWIALVFICACIVPAGALTTEESSAAAARVYVKDATWDPAVFFPGDTGTVSFNVTNGNSMNTTTGVIVNHASIRADDFQITGGKYDSSTNIGPGQTRIFSFSVTSPAVEGTYYPIFSLGYVGADSLWYTSMVQVDASPLEVTLKSQPDTYARDRKDTLNVAISNPRKNTVKNVILSVTGDGAVMNPEKSFLGSIGSGQTVTSNFTVTPSKETTLLLNVTYDNGDNSHSVSTQVPIIFNEDKKLATPVASNIKVKYTAGVYDVTGDVTNAGLSNANAVTVTTGDPGIPANPYQTYVVGTLKPDDFSSFEVTFTAPPGTKTIPLIVTYKDTDGNVFTSSSNVDISGLEPLTKESGSDGVLFTGIGLVIVVALGIGGFLYYRKRKAQA
ncbi:MAG: hypothetical protein ABFC24_00475 [Methanoregulaceae archaeon]